MSSVIQTGREKFVDVLASNSTFKKGYHMISITTTFCLQIQSGADSMAVTTTDLSQLFVTKIARNWVLTAIYSKWMSVNIHKHEDALRIHYILSPTASDIFHGYLDIPFYPHNNSTKV
jgi:hypothetical protein